MNAAREALTRAVNKAIADGSPVITERPTPELVAEREVSANRLPFVHVWHASAVLAAETAIPAKYLSESGLRYRIGAMRAIVTGACKLPNGYGNDVADAAIREIDLANLTLASYQR